MGMEHEELKLAQREQALIQELIKTKQEQKQELEFESFEGYSQISTCNPPRPLLLGETAHAFSLHLHRSFPYQFPVP